MTEQAFSEFAHPDMVLDLTSNVLNPATFEGFDGFLRFAEQVGEAWAEFRMEPEDVFEQGDLVVVLVRAVGTGPRQRRPGRRRRRRGRRGARRPDLHAAASSPIREAALRVVGR